MSCLGLPAADAGRTASSPQGGLTMARTRRRVAAVTLWAALLLALGATQVWAQTGAISGTVTREAGGAGVGRSVLVNVYPNRQRLPLRRGDQRGGRLHHLQSVARHLLPRLTELRRRCGRALSATRPVWTRSAH